MDDDLQQPPEEVPKLLDALEADPDLDAVMGSYTGTKKHAWTRNLGSTLMGAIFRISYGKPKDLRMSSFRAMRKQVAEGMLSFGTVRPVQGALLLQTTYRIVNVPIDHQPRPWQEWAPDTRAGLTVLDNLINISTAPLRLISGPRIPLPSSAADSSPSI